MNLIKDERRYKLIKLEIRKEVLIIDFNKFYVY